MKQPTFYLLLFFLAIAAGLQAQATLSFQGVLRKNSTGAAVDDGQYDLTFQLYETISGGAPIWSETQPAVDVIGGVYTVQLGSVAPLAIPFDKPYFLGVAVDGGAELIPRAQLTAAPYALSLLGETNQFPNDGNVGIGTTAPEEKLHVVGNLKVEGSIETTAGIAGSSAVEGSEELRVIRGWVGENAANPVDIYAGSGFSVTFVDDGGGNRYYEVTFDTPFSGTPTVVVSPAFDSSWTPNDWEANFTGMMTNNTTVNGFKVFAARLGASGQRLVVVYPFSFIAIGPK